MGLDSYLHASKYVPGYDHNSVADNEAYSNVLESIGLSRDDAALESPSLTVEITVAYWRKANAIHNWFVEELADGVDNCEPIYVGRKNLIELRDLVADVLKVKDMQEADPDEALPTAEDLLPTQGGFFFGDTEYDDWYWMQVEYTHDRLTAILDNPKFADFDFTYQASW